MIIHTGLKLFRNMLTVCFQGTKQWLLNGCKFENLHAASEQRLFDIFRQAIRLPFRGLFPLAPTPPPPSCLFWGGGKDLADECRRIFSSGAI